MGKVNNALRMLAILRSRKFVTREELSNELEVNLREITRYKDDLEEAGVLINVTRGRYGGYSLMNKDYLLPLELTKGEIKALAVEKEKNENKEIKTAIEKILAVTPEKYQLTSINVINKFGINKIDDTDIWLKMNDAIINKKRVEIKYCDSYEKETKRKINPYGLFTYYNSNYVLAFCEIRKEIRKFKLTRITEMKMLEENFEVEDFSMKEYMKNNIGIIDNEKIRLKLKIFYPYAKSFKEMVWFENEKIEDFQEDGYLIYEGDTYGKEDIISFILSLKENCIVIEPKEMIDEILQNIDEIRKRYSLS